MRILFVIAFSLWLCGSLWAQESAMIEPKPNLFFNISKIMFSSIDDATINQESPSGGGRYVDLDLPFPFALGIHSITGFYLSRYFSFGAGIGIDHYFSSTHYNASLSRCARIL